MKRALVVVISLGMTLPGSAGEPPKPRKPRLDLRATPRLALPPVQIALVAELVGGDELEDYYCPALEWDWGDGERSQSEADCEPFAPGASFERRFSAHHDYRRAGEYNVRLVLRRAHRQIAAASTNVVVQGGFAGGP